MITTFRSRPLVGFVAAVGAVVLAALGFTALWI